MGAEASMGIGVAKGVAGVSVDLFKGNLEANI
jgi:hypothetical protein